MIRHLLSMSQLDAGQITAVLDTAEQFRAMGERPIKKLPTLRGKTICNLFYEASTRTRVSFELAAKRLSADVINFAADAKSSVAKGETLKDTAWTIEAMGVDAIVIRHPASGAPEQLSRWVRANVINAGDGKHEHPTQALLDLYTLRSHFKELNGLSVAVVGDLLHSRVARSLIAGLRTMGAEVVIVGPPPLVPVHAETWGAKISYDLDAVVGSVDVCYMLRVQKERQRTAGPGGAPEQAEQFYPSDREYARVWGLDAGRLAKLKPEALIMHPGPMNRGVEIAPDVADSSRSVILEQVANGVAVRMSLLYLMLANGAEG